MMKNGCHKYFQTSIESELDVSAIEECIIIIGRSMCLLMCRHHFSWNRSHNQWE